MEFHLKSLGPIAKTFDEGTPGSCGTCRLCCTLMRVELNPPDEPKPEMTPCKYICQTGCSIYDSRPGVCRGFECLWLGSQRWPELVEPWSNSERPDRTGVVMEVNSKGYVCVHCQTPEAYRGDRAWKRIIKLRQHTQVTIEHGNGCVSVVEDDLTLSPMVYIGTDPETNERLYRRNL